MRELLRFVVTFFRVPRRKLILQSLFVAWFELCLFYPALMQGSAKNNSEQAIVLLMIGGPLLFTTWLLFPKRKPPKPAAKPETPD